MDPATFSILLSPRPLYVYKHTNKSVPLSTAWWLALWSIHWPGFFTQLRQIQDNLIKYLKLGPPSVFPQPRPPPVALTGGRNLKSKTLNDWKSFTSIYDDLREGEFPCSSLSLTIPSKQDPDEAKPTTTVPHPADIISTYHWHAVVLVKGLVGHRRWI